MSHAARRKAPVVQCSAGDAAFNLGSEHCPGPRVQPLSLCRNGAAVPLHHATTTTCKARGTDMMLAGAAAAQPQYCSPHAQRTHALLMCCMCCWAALAHDRQSSADRCQLPGGCLPPASCCLLPATAVGQGSKQWAAMGSALRAASWRERVHPGGYGVGGMEVGTSRGSGATSGAYSGATSGATSGGTSDGMLVARWCRK